MAENKVRIRSVRKKRKNNQLAALIGSVILSLMTIVSIILCLIMIMKYHAIRQENIEVLNEIDTMKSEQEMTFTKSETDELITSAVEEAIAQNTQTVTEQVTENIKDTIRDRLNQEESMLSILRTMFPDDVVMYESNRYFCIPIVDSLKKNSYNQEQLQKNSDGIMEYIENDEVVSHKGIDVSKYQNRIDWHKVAEDGVEYAFIRVGIRGYTEGEIIQDDEFVNNVVGANENGIEVGVYFFSQATSVEEAREEARYVLDKIAPYKVERPVVIDVEKISAKNGRTAELTKEERTEYCIAFCETIKEAGYTPMIYGNLHTFMMMLDMEQLEEYDKWFAYYADNYYFPYDFKIWQYSDKGNVSGINADVDMNISFE